MSIVVVILFLNIFCFAVSGFLVRNRPSQAVKLMADLSNDNAADSRTRNFQFVPKNPIESTVFKIASRKLLISTGVAALAVEMILPTNSQAYGDADELARKKKPKKDKVVVQETDLGIQYLVSKKGSGAYPNQGDFVVINYTGFLSDGTVFDTTEGKGKKPLAFRMGEKQVIPGLESVVEMLQAGAEATCTIPSKYAYGQKGVCIKEGECLIPPNEKLRYAIRVKTIGAGYN